MGDCAKTIRNKTNNFLPDCIVRNFTFHGTCHIADFLAHELTAHISITPPLTTFRNPRPGMLIVIAELAELFRIHEVYIFFFF